MSSQHQSVPPARSSHTPGAESDAGRVIRVPRLAHLGVFILLFCVAFAFFGWPQVLWILFVIPAVVVVWIERTRTTVSDNGIDTRTLFGSQHIDWADVRGLRIPKRGYLQLHLADDSDVTLPAVGYNRLADLVAASNGRIPDPFAEPEEEEEADKAESTESVAETTESVAETTKREPETTEPEADSGKS
ncbi:PH domain-containing protein [Nocardia niigatensis]|uniref:PH domain-containing protein n=1 Tax=Nocardia niigatensis TaxID=209249 RepID=UPI0007C58CB7|nr:PH domain-containing protein [Nocardia niigatensis]